MHTVGFYEAIQKNEIMTSVGKWIQLEIIIKRGNPNIYFSLLWILCLYVDVHTCTDRFIYVSVCHQTRKGMRGEGQL